MAEIWNHCGFVPFYFANFSYLAESWLPSLAYLFDEVKKQYQKESLLALCYIGLLTALGEEILFRAALVPSLGLVGASLLAASMVLLFNGNWISLLIWHFGLSLLLAWIMESTGWFALNLFIHAVHNLLSIARMRWVKQVKAIAGN